MTEKEKQNKRWYHYLLNKYIIIGVFFLIWMLFFDQNSYILHKELNKDIEKLNEDNVYLEKRLKSEVEELEDLKNNPEKIEKLAREKYLMKRENEDIFVIEIKDTLNHE